MISGVLDENPSISDLVLHDLRDTSSPKNGACGLTAEPVLRCAIVRQMQQFSYEKLAGKQGRAFFLLQKRESEYILTRPFHSSSSPDDMMKNFYATS